MFNSDDNSSQNPYGQSNNTSGYMQNNLSAYDREKLARQNLQLENCIRMGQETLDNSNNTAQMLQEQSETIQVIDKKLDIVESNQDKAHKIVKSMGSVFGQFKTMLFGIEESKPTPALKTDPKLPQQQQQQKQKNARQNEEVKEQQLSLSKNQPPPTNYHEVQDSQIDTLLSLVRQTKETQSNIGVEMDRQNEQLDKLNTKMDRVNAKGEILLKDTNKLLK